MIKELFLLELTTVERHPVWELYTLFSRGQKILKFVISRNETGEKSTR
jgi:hypothetical protein